MTRFPRQSQRLPVLFGFGLAWAGTEDVRVGFDLNLYESDSGEAGRLSSAEFAADRDLTKTPYNRVKIDRLIAALAEPGVEREGERVHRRLLQQFEVAPSGQARGNENPRRAGHALGRTRWT